MTDVVDKVAEKIPDWVDGLLEKAPAKVEAMPLGYSKIVAREGLRFVEDNRDTVVKLGQSTLLEVASFVHFGQLDEGRAAFLRSASFDELMAASADMSAEVANEARKRAATEAEWRAFAAQLAKVAIGLIPLLVAL